MDLPTWPPQMGRSVIGAFFNPFTTLVAVLVAEPVVAGFAGTDAFLPMVGRQVGVFASNWYATAWSCSPGAGAVRYAGGKHPTERGSRCAP
jgi:hypothetical protein